MNPTINYCDATYGQIFWDHENSVIMGIHENDSPLDHDNLKTLMDHFGMVLVYHETVPKFVKEWVEYENYGEPDDDDEENTDEEE